MSQDQIIVLCYFLAWCFTLWKYYKKVKSFNTACFILFTYALYACFSFLLYGTSYPYFEPKPLKVFPFVYLYLALFIGLYPVMKYGEISNIQIEHPPLSIINTFSVIFILSTLIHLPSIISNISSGLVMLIADSSNASTLYRDGLAMTENTGKSISNLAAIVSNSFTGVGFFLTAYSFTLQKRSKIILYGLVLACFVKMTSGIADGSRGAIVEYLLLSISSIFLFYNKFTAKIKHYVIGLGLTITLMLSIPMVLITVGRFGADNIDPLESVYYYAGVQNINFNNYALDDNGIRYGDRVLPLFKRMVGFDNVPRNFFERRLKYPHLYLNDESFSTYVGDFAIDFGPFLGFLFISLISLTVYSKTRIKRGIVHLHQLLMLHLLVYMCTVGGLKLFPFADASGLQIIVYALTYLFFKYLT